MTERVEMFRAEHPDLVMALAQHMADAHNTFCETHPQMTEWDDFMGVHNFHKGFILNFEQQRGIKTAEAQLVFRQMAVDTFREGLENQPAYQQKPKRKTRRR